MRSMAVVFLMSLLLPLYVLAEDAEYANIFDGKGAVLGVSANGVRLTDLISPARYCNAADQYVCVVSKPFVFAIPKTEKGIGKSWSHSGAQYKITSANETPLLGGKSIRYWVVRQQWNGLVTQYAYSDDYGVIAIRASGGQQLILLGKCGFGAISDIQLCRQESAQ